MQLPTDDLPTDSTAQRLADRHRWRRAFTLSLTFVLVLTMVFSAQGSFDITPWTVRPLSVAGLLGVLSAPLLHGSFEHLAGNAIALLLLGTLAGGLYPRASARGLPLIWLASGLAAWLLGEVGSRHLGASGIAHGLMFLVLTLGLLRRDRPAIAAAMIAFFLYGGMLLTVFPREIGVSWQAHLGGAVGGVIAALALRRRDPQAPRKRYSWEHDDREHDGIEPAAAIDAAELEQPRPDEVPVLWQREPDHDDGDDPRGVVLRFPRRH